MSPLPISYVLCLVLAIQNQNNVLAKCEKNVILFIDMLADVLCRRGGEVVWLLWNRECVVMVVVEQSSLV